MKLLFVEWHDHHSFTTNEWRDFEDFEDETPLVVESAGWLVRENKTHLIIAAHHALRAGKVCGEMMILKSAITRRKTLKGIKR